MKRINKDKELDKFYTKKDIAITSLKEFISIIKLTTIDFSKLNWIEPSAGSGNFLYALKDIFGENILEKIQAYDIEPDNIDNNIKIDKQDFLTLNKKHNINNIIFGNPPFGKKSKLAIDFINKSSEIADIIFFILPVQFKRYNTQKKLNGNLKLIHSSNIEEDSFLFKDKSYNVNCIIQIYVNKNRKEFKEFKDLRKYEKEITKHTDFETFIYNNTPSTLKYFNQEEFKWDFAIPRQGYYDYNNIVINSKDLKKNMQYFFVKCNNDFCTSFIHYNDFNKLSKSNTMTPGFSTSDFVEAYEEFINKIKNI